MPGVEITNTHVPTPVETMAKERSSPSFDVRSCTFAMHGGKRVVELKYAFILLAEL